MMKVYLGKEIPIFGVKELEDLNNIELNLNEFLDHTLICGASGCGKTVLAKAIIEDFALAGIPSIIIDSKGDLGSLGLVFPHLRPESFISWVDVDEKDEMKSVASSHAKRYVHRLKLFDISPAAVEALANNVRTTIFTPKEDYGVRLSIPSLPPIPIDINELLKKDLNQIMLQASSVAVSLIERIYPGESLEKFEREINFLTQLIFHSWQGKLRLEGIKGIKLLVELIQHPPVKRIGVVPMDRFIMSHKRKDLAIKINGLLLGGEQAWYNGLPLEMKTLLGEKLPHPKTQISVINISHLDKIEERSAVIAQVIQTVISWMKQCGPTQRPRLLLYIDEINKVGIHRSIFPKSPNFTAAKFMLTRLFEMAKDYGVAVVVGASTTSNIDYKALAACRNWMIGCLNSPREWQNLRNGLSDISMQVEQIARDHNLARTGEFILKLKDGSVKYFHQRWLMSYHRPFSVMDVKRYTSENSFDQTESFTKEVVYEDRKTAIYTSSSKDVNCFEVLDGENKGKKIYLKDGENFYGRNEFCPNNVHISRRHFRIIKKDLDFYIKDSSTNGTFIGGRKIDIRRLEPDDEIILGKNEVTLKYIK